MSAAIGAVAGGGLAGISSILSLGSQNKAVIGQIEREGQVLSSQMRQININRDQLDRELGDVLSSNALTTAKDMATAKVIMSGSGTIGGTTAQVSKQAYMEQIKTDAQYIAQARNSEMGMLTDAVSKNMNFRLQSDANRSQIKSPLEAFIGTTTAIIGGASSGASMGSSFNSAASAQTIAPTMTGVRQGAYTPIYR